ncbi:hypothetical protein [Halalkalibaculum sp. DA384]|uniref:hypothetical protein n=1 Tax=Halalkalibaculum sp. DA384 TaxID=3373606 RepID=UPI00375445F7
MDKEKSFRERIREKVTVELLVKVIIGIVSVSGIGWFWSLFNTEYSIPLYVPIGSFLLGMGVVYGYRKIKEFSQESHKDYRKDEFWGVIWKWDYDTRKNVSNPSIQPICPECNSAMWTFPNNHPAKKPETAFVCSNDECELSLRGEGDEPCITKDGTTEGIYGQLSSKVDKNLRDMGLKL